MLTIRLQRVGRKNTPLFRVVATDSKNPPKGKFLEVVGSYNPKTKAINLKSDRVTHYLAHGATCSDTVWNLFVREGVVPGLKRPFKSSRPQSAVAADAPAPVTVGVGAEPEAAEADGSTGQG
ncbi:30S ribosomal protein S16 [Candidatus Parcubacteria bacterium]|nr:30S ribosomal protein S16 [Candidatus Parcubacteria bacterium]